MTSSSSCVADFFCVFLLPVFGCTIRMAGSSTSIGSISCASGRASCGELAVSFFRESPMPDKEGPDHCGKAKGPIAEIRATKAFLHV